MTREPEWSLQDAALAVALTRIEDSTCPGCGNDLNHTMTVTEPYDVDTEAVCWACRARDIVTRLDQSKHREEEERLDRAKNFSAPRRADGRKYPVRPMRPEELEG